MPLPAREPFGPVVAVGAADLGRLDRLAVGAAGGGVRAGACLPADGAWKGIVDRAPSPVVPPPPEVVVHGPPRGEVMGQGPPGAAVSVAIEDGVDDRTETRLAGSPEVPIRREQGPQEGPSGIGQVARIGCGVHPLSTSESVLWNRLSGCEGVVGEAGVGRDP